MSKKNRRNTLKYPGLNARVNLPSRKDLIETNYINGVRNKDGELVIRPLNDEEKTFLNKFYEETIITNFLHNKDLRTLSKIKKSILEDDIILELKEKIKTLKEEKHTEEVLKKIKNLKEIIKITKKQNEETFNERLTDLEDQMQDLREEHLLYPDKNDHKRFYNANNSRNNCLYTKMKTHYTLDFVDFSDEYQYDLLKQEWIDGEQKIIDNLERHYWEEEEDRLKKIRQNEKRELKIKKLKKSSNNSHNSSNDS